MLTELRALTLALKDRLLPKNLISRAAEPALVMNTESSVESFHRAGEELFLPIYHLNAIIISSLVRHGGTIMDLGSGSAQFLTYLAQRRPDLTLIGFELSDAMLDRARQHILELGLQNQIEMRKGDMRGFASSLHTTESCDLVTSIFSLHHLADEADLEECLEQVAKCQRGFGSKFYFFDFARPRRHQTAAEFPKVFSHANKDLWTDSINSLLASWTYQELSAAITKKLNVQSGGRLSAVLPLFHLHCSEQAAFERLKDGDTNWRANANLSNQHLKKTKDLARLLGIAGEAVRK